MRRVGVDQVLTFQITRAVIHIRSVYLSLMLDDRIGYVALSPVSETAYRRKELTDAITDLTKKGRKALILDLRGNPGGLLDQGIAVSNLFLDPGQEVVETRGRAPNSTRVYRDAQAQAWPTLPIIVMVNGGSASAAEIIAGALQDHDRALLVGTPTFGKGLVQSLWQLSQETALKLTTARWYTPSGRTIQRRSRDEADQEAQVAMAEAGRDTTRPDTTLFHTDRGRVEYGGGGIRPDVFVAPDTFTTGERAFLKALGPKVTTYRDVLSSYALELKGEGRLGSPTFPVTDEMVSEVFRRLRARGGDARRQHGTGRARPGGPGARVRGGAVRVWPDGRIPTPARGRPRAARGPDAAAAREIPAGPVGVSAGRTLGGHPQLDRGPTARRAERRRRAVSIVGRCAPRAAPRTETPPPRRARSRGSRAG